AQVLTAAKESGVEVVLMFRTGVPAALSRFADPAFLPVLMRQSGTDDEDIAQAIAGHPGTAKCTQLRVHRLSDAVEDMVEGAATEYNVSADSGVAYDLFISDHELQGYDTVFRYADAMVTLLELVPPVLYPKEWQLVTLT